MQNTQRNKPPDIITFDTKFLEPVSKTRSLPRFLRKYIMENPVPERVIRPLVDMDKTKQKAVYYEILLSLANFLYEYKVVFASNVSILGLFRQLDTFKTWDKPVMIIGDTGTGKELIANALFNYGSRHKTKIFVAINCSAISPGIMASELFGHVKGSHTGAVSDRKGYFEKANRGVLFLDEIHHLTREAQSSLLRVLEAKSIMPVGSSNSKKIDVQIYVGTNKPDKWFVENSDKFAADLYYRIKGKIFRMPSLSERSYLDKQALCEYFILSEIRAQGWKQLKLNKKIFDLLWDTEYSGNIREMKNMCEVIVHDVYHSQDPVKSFFSNISPYTKGNFNVFEHTDFYEYFAEEKKRNAVNEKYEPSQIQQSEQFNPYSSFLELPFQEATKEAKRQFCREWIQDKKQKHSDKTQEEIARMYNIAPSTISRMK